MNRAAIDGYQTVLEWGRQGVGRQPCSQKSRSRYDKSGQLVLNKGAKARLAEGE